MAFTKLTAFTKKVADMADQPTGTAAELKAWFDAAPDEVRTYLNSLIDGLKSTASGDSGAKNIGVTPITGLTGTDAQTILESINTTFANKNRGLDWIPATFVNTFTDWGNPSYPTVATTKDELGIVRFRGMVKAVTFGNGNPMFNLPLGQWPSKFLNFAVPAFHASMGYGTALIEVNSNGNVTTTVGLFNGTTGHPLWVDVIGISYPTTVS